MRSAGLYYSYLAFSGSNGGRNARGVAWTQGAEPGKAVLRGQRDPHDEEGAMARARYPTASDELEQAWVEVSTARPCPICGAVRQCLRLTSGDLVDCHQTVSDRPMVDGGWLQHLERLPVLDSPEAVAVR
jgi:hypothetical protein